MVGHRLKNKENEKRDKYLDLARDLKKFWTMKMMLIFKIGAFEMVPKGLVRGLERIGYRKTSKDYANYSITKSGQNTEKSPGDVRRLVVTWIPVKDHQLTLVWKTQRVN